jgi:hypothetical protein
MKRTGMILAVFLALGVFSAQALSVDETGKVKTDPKQKAAPVTDSGAKATKQEVNEPVEKAQEKPKTQVVTPTQISPSEDKTPAEIRPAEPQGMQELSTSVIRDKGRKISWQIICSGGNCGYGSPIYWLGSKGGYHLCGTAGQVSVGPGTSPSFGVNSGFWQEVVAGLRGDVNGDGIINVGDVVFLVSYLYRGGLAPDPLWIGDANCDYIVNVGDVVYLVSYLYRGGPPPHC